MSKKETEYFYWESISGDFEHACFLGDLRALKGGSNDLADFLWAGTSLKPKISPTTFFQMDKEHPRDTVLFDNVANAGPFIIVSERLKKFLEAQELPEVEYLKIIIRDQKGKVASKDYYIVHPLNSPDCLDYKASGAKMATYITDVKVVESLKKVVLKKDPKRPLFRIAGYLAGPFVSGELAKAIKKAGFTGVYFKKLKVYKT